MELKLGAALANNEVKKNSKCPLCQSICTYNNYYEAGIKENCMGTVDIHPI